MPEVTEQEVRTVIAAGGAVEVQGQRGFARMSRLRPGVAHYLCRGYFSQAFAGPMIAFADSEVRTAGRLHMVTDAWELSSVEAAYREAWTTWFRAHKQHFTMDLLIRSKLMEMAASLANLFTGVTVVTTHSRVDAWERAVGRHVPGFSRP